MQSQTVSLEFVLGMLALKKSWYFSHRYSGHLLEIDLVCCYFFNIDVGS